MARSKKTKHRSPRGLQPRRGWWPWAHPIVSYIRSVRIDASVWMKSCGTYAERGKYGIGGAASELNISIHWEASELNIST